ncbi:hypothetical protein [Nostoc sp.]|uniref:hypothetical protein n=1 Tax=Nostoc sp. TaxID=1180 RepID=UPI002FF8A4DE
MKPRIGSFCLYSRDRPEDIRAFVRGWLQATTYWKANVQEGNTIISKALKIPKNTISFEGVNLTNLGENQKFFQSSNPHSFLAAMYNAKQEGRDRYCTN